MYSAGTMPAGVLQCIAVLHYVAVCCGILQCVMPVLCTLGAFGGHCARRFVHDAFICAT